MRHVNWGDTSFVVPAFRPISQNEFLAVQSTANAGYCSGSDHVLGGDKTLYIRQDGRYYASENPIDDKIWECVNQFPPTDWIR